MALQDTYPFYLANRPQSPNADLEVIDKYTGETATRVAKAGPDILEQAIAKAVEAATPLRRLHAYQRRDVLLHCVERFEARHEELALALCIEAGKPIRDARGEATRLIDTFRVAAEEATRIYGEVFPMDASPRAAGYRGMWQRVPVGPCSFISPFNFPLNLAAHKIAPAIAAGCPFVLKPASYTPVGALIIGETLAECAVLPEGTFSILPMSRDAADLLTTDDRMKLLSFTGSPSVGWDLKTKAGKKKVVLELGGNAACIVDRDADLDDTIDRCLLGGFYQSGQSCIAVQRLLVHAEIHDDFRDRYVEAVRNLKAGNPRDEDTFVGPIISDGEADRIAEWIEEAVSRGAKVLCGGGRDGRMIEPTVLTDVPRDAKASCEEIFGPVVVLEPFDDFEEALRRADDSDYGLQAGVFTRDVERILDAWDDLEVGGVMINDVPSYRVDHMPYGGVKDSGLGREGLRWAIEDMTEIRLLGIRRVGR